MDQQYAKQTITADGCVHTCGYGVLGLGADVLETLTLRKVPGLANVKRVFAATDYAAALTGESAARPSRGFYTDAAYC